MNKLNTLFLVVALSLFIEARAHYYEPSTVANSGKKTISNTADYLIQATEEKVWDIDRQKTKYHYEIMFKKHGFKANFATLVKSDYRVHDQGFRYHGIARTHSINELSPKEARLGYWTGFKTLFHFEASYDGLNTYDRGILSFGLLQANHTGEILALMGEFKQKYPYLFQKYFGRYGISLHMKYESYKDQWKVNDIEYLDEYGKKAWLEIAKNMELMASFIEAGHTPEMQACQRMVIIKYYLGELMQRTVTFHNKPKTIGNIMNSEVARAAIMTLAVKFGVTGAQKRFQAGLDRISHRYQSFLQVDEVEWLKSIELVANEVEVSKRINYILETAPSSAYAVR